MAKHEMSQPPGATNGAQAQVPIVIIRETSFQSCQFATLQFNNYTGTNFYYQGNADKRQAGG